MNVLLIENDQSDIILFREALKDQDEAPDLRIAVVHSIKESLKAIMSGEYDIILLDINIDKSENLDGLKQLLKYASRMPIVVYSSVYSSELAREAIALGAQDYIVKGTMGKLDLVRALVHAKIRHDNLMRIRDLVQ